MFLFFILKKIMLATNLTITVLFTSFLIFTQGMIASPGAIAAEGETEKEILYWIAPMNPSYRRDKPGKSPMNMDLVPVYAGDKDDGSSVTISPAVVQNLGVRTKRAELSRLWRGIDTVGYVGYDESLVSHIHLRTSGWIENLAVRSAGERVKKGDRLFDLYSPELVNAQEEFVTALSSRNKGLIRASKGKLTALGVSSSQIKALQKSRKVQQLISTYARQNGVVSTLPVREGMYVKPSMRVMSLADLSSVWLLAEVFERQANWVQEGQSAEVKLSFLPGKTWEGKVEYIYPDLDPKTRTLKVRLRFDNPGERLKPNMYANIKIYGAAKENIIIIPIEGLIRTGRKERVIIDIGDGKFQSREVISGIESGDYVEIIKGVNDGDKIVVSSQFLIDSEANMRASVIRMSDDMSAEIKISSDEVPEIVSGTGVIKAVMVDERKLNLQHEPITALGWPAMNMDFSLSDDVDISNLMVDEKIMFQLEERNENYLIISIHKISDMKNMENKP